MAEVVVDVDGWAGSRTASGALVRLAPTTGSDD
jgi:hypothetical protein